MRVIPSILIRGGRALDVREGVAGTAGTESVAAEDPAFLANRLGAVGFGAVHVTDLDAVLAKRDSEDALFDVLRQSAIPAQVDVAAEEIETIDELLARAADRVLLGARALRDGGWLERAAAAAPGQLIVSVDLRGRRARARHARIDISRDLFDLVAEIDSLPIASLQLHIGALGVSELSLVEEVAGHASTPVAISVVSADLRELRNAESAGAEALVLERLPESSALDPRLIAEEFAA